MREYIDRLIRCGFPPHDAYSVCYSIARELGESELEVYIGSIESCVYGVPYVD